MSFLNKIKDDIESDLLTTTYPTLRTKFKKVIYEDPDENVVIYQKYFGLNNYNTDLSQIYLIDENKQIKRLNYYLFSDDIKQIKFYNNNIIIITESDEKKIFKKNYWIKYYYIWDTLKKIFLCKNEMFNCYYLQI